jgi:hypothetical protein
MTTFSPLRRLSLAAALLAVTAFAGACKDFMSIPASVANFTDNDSVYAVNGTPPGSPTALKFFDGTVRRADQGFAYDLVFDIDPAGNVLLIPARALATNFSTPYSVGLLKVPGTFESILEAPQGAYRVDTAMVVATGQTVVAEVHDIPGVCQFSPKGSSYFAKLMITDVDLERRTIGFIVTVNRNCGFRSFAPGIPRD